MIGRIYRMAASILLVLLSMLLLVIVATGDGNVTMESLTIYNTHEWFGIKPTVYFRCHEESKVYLPDVTHKNQDYAFIGQESWQPLTTLYGEKCKRCGVYEEDAVKGDDVFYEGELCPKDFAASPPGRLIIVKAKELNASLLCARCNSSSSAGTTTSDDSRENDKDDKGGGGLVYIIIALVFVYLSALGVVTYTKWRQKQRSDQHARFLNMFEDGHELDSELGLGLTEDDL